MEYNLQKTLDTTEFDFDFESQIFDDEIPGIGQVVPFDNVIVPLYHNADLTTIIKGDNSEQLGSGNVKETSEIDEGGQKSDNEVLPDEQLNTDVETNTTSEIETGTKRKQLDNSIYESFMHPKMFKTKTVEFTPQVSQVLTKTNNDLKENSKKLKHKFKIL